MKVVGYAWLVERPQVHAPTPDHILEVRSVSRIEVMGSY